MRARQRLLILLPLALSIAAAPAILASRPLAPDDEVQVEPGTLPEILECDSAYPPEPGLLGDDTLEYRELETEGPDRSTDAEYEQWLDY